MRRPSCGCRCCLPGAQCPPASCCPSCALPAGTLATLCLEAPDAAANSSACAGWQTFCDSDAGAGFWALCRREAPAPAPAPAAASAAAEEPSESAASADRVPAAGVAASGCYTNPRQASCSTFQHPDAESEKDAQQLCAATPAMPGCTLWRQCGSGGASGAYCQPFSLLGSICSMAPALAGCERWAGLCATPGSAVQQCVTGERGGRAGGMHAWGLAGLRLGGVACRREPQILRCRSSTPPVVYPPALPAAAPIRGVLSTSQALDAVMSGCTAAAGAKVPGCSDCVTAGWSSAGCADPLAVLGALCSAQPGLQQCASLATMCSEAGNTFRSLCSSGAKAPAASAAGAAGTAAQSSGSGEVTSPSAGAGSSSTDALNKMYLHASMTGQQWMALDSRVCGAAPALASLIAAPGTCSSMPEN